MDHRNPRMTALTGLWTDLRSRRWFGVVAVGTVTLLASAVLFATGPEGIPDTHTERAWAVSVLVAEPHDAHPHFEAFGRIEPHNVASLRSDLSAQVAEVRVREGEWVDAGDTLVRLDDARYRLLVRQRQATLNQLLARSAELESELATARSNAAHYRSINDIARAKLERHEELMAQRLISSAVYDEARRQADEASVAFAAYKQTLSNLPHRIDALRAEAAGARAALELAELDLARTQITAPFAGPVLTVSVGVGDHTSIASDLVSMADADAFELRVQVPDNHRATLLRQLAHDASGQDTDPIIATTENGWRFRLERLAQRVKSGQSVPDAFFVWMDDGGASPAVGQVLDVSVRLPLQRNVVAVPIHALYNDDTLYLVENDRIRGIAVVRVGERISNDGSFEVLVRSQQIAPGARLVSTQLPNALTGMLVDVLPATVRGHAAEPPEPSKTDA